MTKRTAPPPFPLSKIMDPRVDLPFLAEGGCDVILSRANALEGQHELRAWEYGMALHAIHQWHTSTCETPLQSIQVCDVGGAGSRFWKALQVVSAEPILLIDPNPLPETVEAGCQYFRGTVEDYAADHPHDQWDVLTAISVIEHVPEPRAFLRACRMLLKPGGLLFLTTDCWNCSGPDTAHFHWMRERIYNVDTIKKLLAQMRELGFRTFGHSDWSYSGDHLFGSYSFASMCMAKEWPNGRRRSP